MGNNCMSTAKTFEELRPPAIDSILDKRKTPNNF